MRVYVCEDDTVCATGDTKEGCNAVYEVGVRHHCVFAKYGVGGYLGVVINVDLVGLREFPGAPGQYVGNC